MAGAGLSSCHAPPAAVLLVGDLLGIPASLLVYGYTSAAKRHSFISGFWEVNWVVDLQEA